MLPSDVAAYEVPLLLSCIAVFVGGLGEDIGRDVSPKKPLILSLILRSARLQFFEFGSGPWDFLIGIGLLDPSWGDRIHCVDFGQRGACDKSD